MSTSSSTSSSVESAEYGRRVPWVDVLLSAIASVSWALIGMAGTAALGLHLLEADSAGSLGPMTAAVVALGAGGSVTPSGDVSAFGLKGAQAHTAVTITPLGVSLVGALLLSWFFLRSLRAAGVVVAPAELLARAGAVVALFVATLGGLAWAGHDVITIDGGSLGLGKLPTGAGGGISIPGLGDLGGLLPDNVGKLIHAKAAVGFTVDTAPTLLGGLGWSAGILLIALLVSRRTPLPRGWRAAHRVARPAASALVTVLLAAAVAGLAAAAYAATGDAHPRRIAGAALLGAPNGAWLGMPVGLFLPFDGRATGELARLLPDPLDDLLTASTDQQVTLGRLAELDGRVWLLAVAAAVTMLLAGVLTAVRTPVAGGPAGGPGAAGFAGRCALRLGIATAVAMPLLAWLTQVSVDASLSVLGFDAFGAGIWLHGRLGTALLLGALWGAGAGAAGALLAWAGGAAGRRAAPFARALAPVAEAGPAAGAAGVGGGDPEAPDKGGAGGAAGGDGGGGDGASGGGEAVSGGAGPYEPGVPYRPPNPATNPYLLVPDELREPEDARPPDGPGPLRGARHGGDRGSARPADDGARHPEGPPPAEPDVYGAPTVVRHLGAPPPRPPRPPRQPSGPVSSREPSGPVSEPVSGRDAGPAPGSAPEGPPPPPPPPATPPATPPRKPPRTAPRKPKTDR